MVKQQELDKRGGTLVQLIENLADLPTEVALDRLKWLRALKAEKNLSPKELEEELAKGVDEVVQNFLDKIR